MATISVTLPTDGTTADVSDYNTPITTIVNEINGGLDNDNIKSAAAISGSKLADNSIDIGAKASTWDGWVEVSDSWTYASATTITVPSDATAKYSVGDKIKLTQSTVKYFYIVGVASTTLTIYGGSDYTLVNAAISDVSYSKAATPLGFPVWFNFTPSWTNLTPGSGTNNGRVSLTGKTVHVKTNFVFGSGSSVGSAPKITLPITASTSSMRADTTHMGRTWILDSGTAAFQGDIRYSSATSGEYLVANAAGTYLASSAISSTVPMTWTTNDELNGWLVYEAA